MRHTRKEVVDRTKREFARLDRVVSPVTLADGKRPVPRSAARDPWTVQDALTHIRYWKESTLRVIRGEPRLPEMRGLDIEAINRLIYESWRRRRPSELVSWHRRVHADVLETLVEDPARVLRPS